MIQITLVFLAEIRTVWMQFAILLLLHIYIYWMLGAKFGTHHHQNCSLVPVWHVPSFLDYCRMDISGWALLLESWFSILAWIGRLLHLKSIHLLWRIYRKYFHRWCVFCKLDDRQALLFMQVDRTYLLKIEKHLCIWKECDVLRSVHSTQQLCCDADISITSLLQVTAASPHFKLKLIWLSCDIVMQQLRCNMNRS